MQSKILDLSENGYENIISFGNKIMIDKETKKCE